MEEQPNNEPLADVIPINRHRSVEVINGLQLDLGRMSLDELKALEDLCVTECQERDHDLQVVQEYIEQREQS